MKKYLLIFVLFLNIIYNPVGHASGVSAPIESKQEAQSSAFIQILAGCFFQNATHVAWYFFDKNFSKMMYDMFNIRRNQDIKLVKSFLLDLTKILPMNWFWKSSIGQMISSKFRSSEGYVEITQREARAIVQAIWLLHKDDIAFSLSDATSEELQGFVKILTGMKKLKKLNLGESSISEEVSEELAQVFSSLPIEELHFSLKSFNDTNAFKAFCDAVSSLKRLKKISVSSVTSGSVDFFEQLSDWSAWLEQVTLEVGPNSDHDGIISLVNGFNFSKNKNFLEGVNQRIMSND